MKTRVCHICGTTVGKHDPCPTCTEEWPKRRDVATMTVEECCEELRLLLGVVEIDLDHALQRIRELMGRPVWSHELANKNLLLAELRSRRQATVTDVLKKLPPDKLIVAQR